jgi:predicted XRE-type DNA-binding protein
LYQEALIDYPFKVNEQEKEPLLPLVNISEVDLNDPEIWRDNRAEFIQIYNGTLPHVATALRSTAYQLANSWELFVKTIYRGLDDEIEDSTDDFCFVHYLADAEIWLAYEKEFNDGRRTDTAEQVIQLFYKEKMSRAEIAKTLNISRQRIHTILKDIRSANFKKLKNINKS